MIASQCIYKSEPLQVTSYGKGINKIMKHLAYISRNFDLALEDQDKSLLNSRENVNELLSSWESIYFDNRKNTRDTAHLMFSVPPKTDRAIFNKLTREFLQEEYEGEHDYLFVQHNDTEHPHIHSVICLRSINGEKLDPRKKYLNELRKSFAKKCRDHGIMLDSSRRFERGLSGKSVKSELVQMREKRNSLPHVDKQLLDRVKNEMVTNKKVVNTGELVRKQRNQKFRDQFYNTAKKLYENYMTTPEGQRKDKDIKAAKLLFDYSKEFPNEITRADYLKELLHKESSKEIGKKSDFLGLKELVNEKKITFNKTDIELGED